ncbi:MAG: hypothetical protein KU29_04795 [Sulfurovum sp. FS06-10]|nr:MAG: hypothetical protein KU29_04795 [Sulfurovum sp. FS06-10]
MQSLATNIGIAWKLVSDFNQIDSLFKEQELPYKVITHVCSCQAVHVRIVSQDDEWHCDDYVCAQCLNETFYRSFRSFSIVMVFSASSCVMHYPFITIFYLY